VIRGTPYIKAALASPATLNRTKVATRDASALAMDAAADGVLEASDNDYADAALHEVMARAKHSPISPQMVRAAREAVGVSRRQAGKVFGGGPTAFYKYETAKAVPSEGKANLLRLALERPDLFTQPARGTFNWPSAQDAQLLRRAITDDRLGAIVRRIYPQTDAAEV
jgi:DNA-binding transcriptional regulator YiaG